MKQSKFLTLNLHDAAKSAILAALTVLVSSLIQILDSGHLPNFEQLKTSGLAALIAGFSYLLKNILTDENDRFLPKTTNPDKPRPPKP